MDDEEEANTGLSQTRALKGGSPINSLPLPLSDRLGGTVLAVDAIKREREGWGEGEGDAIKEHVCTAGMLF